MQNPGSEFINMFSVLFPSIWQVAFLKIVYMDCDKKMAQEKKQLSTSSKRNLSKTKIK